MLSMTALVRNLVNEGQDFEWYPTTQTMIDVVDADIRKRHESSANVLDCGAGDGRVLDRLAGKCGKKYSIEKSAILASRQPRDVIPVGTDFYQATLIDKKVDVVFCNPPYSDYANWAAKIIKEANAPMSTLSFLSVGKNQKPLRLHWKHEMLTPISSIRATS
jgi:hypothetical protein